MKQHSQLPQRIPTSTEQLIECWRQNSLGKPVSTEHTEKHRRIVKLLEQKLRHHLSWSLDRVCVRGDEQTSMSDANNVIPDIWVETLSNNPVLTRQVVETKLIIAVIDRIEDESKRVALERCLGISSLNEFVLFNLIDSSVEIFRRAKDGWTSVTSKDTALFESVGLRLHMDDVFASQSEKRSCNESNIREAIRYSDKPLPYRPDIQTTESGRGYLLRVAEELEYKSAQVLTSFVAPGLNMMAIDEKGKLERLAHILRYPEIEFKRHFFCLVPNSLQREFFGHKLRRSFLNYQIPRVCPACLTEYPVCQAVWDLSLVCACPKHECALIDSCPKCARKLSWGRSSVTKCDCGHDLTGAQLKQVSPHVLVMTKVIHNATHSSISNAFEVTSTNYCQELLNLSLPSLLRTILFLGATLNPSSMRMTHQPFKPTSIDQQLELTETASVILSEWPKNYIDYFRRTNDTLQAEELDDKTLTKVFGNYYRHLFGVLKESEFDFLRKQFGRFIREEWDGLVRGGQKSIGDINSTSKKWISPTEASTLFDGIPVSAIRRLGKDGAIKGKWLKEGPQGGRQLLLERSSVEEWINETKKWIPRKTVEEILGLDHRSVMALGKAGLLKFKRGECLGRKVAWNFQEEDVQRIIEAFEKHNVQKILHKDVDENLISLKEAVFRFLGFNKGLPDVISAVIEGRLTPTACISEFEGVCGYTFPLSEIRKYRHSDVATPEGGLLTIQETSIELKVDYRGVSALLKAGYLKLSDKQSFRNERLISAKDIASFKERYVFPRELAEPNKVSLVWVNEYLANIGVERILLTGNQYYTYMYERHLVDKLEIPPSKKKRNSYQQ